MALKIIEHSLTGSYTHINIFKKIFFRKHHKSAPLILPNDN